jgi:hypothetical protein
VILDQWSRRLGKGLKNLKEPTVRWERFKPGHVFDTTVRTKAKRSGNYFP